MKEKFLRKFFIFGCVGFLVGGVFLGVRVREEATVPRPGEAKEMIEAESTRSATEEDEDGDEDGILPLEQKSGDEDTYDADILVSSQVLAAPFISQAPRGEWKNALFQNGCEEASVFMASRLGNDEPVSEEHAEQALLALAHLSEQLFDTSVDTSAEDTLQLFRVYTGKENGRLMEQVTGEVLRATLARGEAMIIPMNGRLLGNPHFTAPGPETHMLVLLGYDVVTEEYIAHDPGTRFGAEYRYPRERFENAIRDYPTGNHLSITSVAKRAIVIGK